jgi:hypothetical protein
VGGEHNVWSTQQRRLQRRFSAEHIQTRTGNQTGAQRPEKRVLIDNPPAAGIDNAKTRFGNGELLVRDHACCFGGFGDVDGDKVSSAKQFIELH